jgi:hypothetical protein
MEEEPLLDEALAAEFFGPAATDAASAVMLGEILRELVADVPPRLAALAASPEQDGRRELHQLRGATASLALQRAASRLGLLEQHWPVLAAGARGEALRAAEIDFRAGVTALQARFPFLAD